MGHKRAASRFTVLQIQGSHSSKSDDSTVPEGGLSQIIARFRSELMADVVWLGRERLNQEKNHSKAISWRKTSYSHLAS